MYFISLRVTFHLVFDGAHHTSISCACMLCAVCIKMFYVFNMKIEISVTDSLGLVSIESITNSKLQHFIENEFGYVYF